MSACCRTIFRAPSASEIVTTAGSASGMAATASERAVRNMRSGSSPRSIPTPKNTAHSPRTAPASRWPKRPSRRWRGVRPSSSSRSSVAILPSSVRIPVATTRPTPRPFETSVPSKRHAAAVADGEVRRGEGVDGLLDGLRLAGERGLVGPQLDGLDEPQVGGEHVPRLEEHDVAGHEVDGGHDRDRAPPPDARVGRGERLERAHGLLRPVLLHDAEPCVEHHDDRDDHRVLGLAEEPRQDGGGDEHQHHDVGELVEQHPPEPAATPFRERVRARLEPATCDLRGVEPRRDRGAQARRGFVGRQRVPGSCGQRRARGCRPLRGLARRDAAAPCGRQHPTRSGRARPRAAATLSMHPNGRRPLRTVAITPLRAARRPRKAKERPPRGEDRSLRDSPQRGARPVRDGRQRLLNWKRARAPR